MIKRYVAAREAVCSFPHSPVTSSLLGPNIFLSTPFSNTLSLRSSLNVSDQVSHPHKTTDINRRQSCKLGTVYKRHSALTQTNTVHTSNDVNLTQHVFYVKGNWGYRHTLRICDIYCFSGATAVSERASLLCQVHFQPCYSMVLLLVPVSYITLTLLDGCTLHLVWNKSSLPTWCNICLF